PDFEGNLMDFRTILPGLGALAVLSLPALAGTLAEPSTTAAETSEFGEPLFVNGKRITDNAIKRHLISGPCRWRMEMSKFTLIIDDEIARRAQLAGDQAVAPEVSPVAMKAAEAAVEGKSFGTPEEKQKAY